MHQHREQREDIRAGAHRPPAPVPRHRQAPPVGLAAGNRAMARFAAAALATRYKDWADEIRSPVGAAGEGAKGGVYFLDSKTAHKGLKRVVVKPLIGDEGADQTQFGDAFLRAMGVNVPASRVIERSDPEFAVLANAGLKAAYEQKTARGFDEVLGVKLMGAAPGESLAQRSKGMVTTAHLAELQALLSSKQTYMALGRMVVADAAIANDDRLAFQGGQSQVNLGNIMVGENRDLWAIDTASFLKKATAVNVVGLANTVNPAQMVKLIDPARVRQLGDDFLDAIVHAAVHTTVPQDPGITPPLSTQLATWVQGNRGLYTQYFADGVAAAFASLERLLRAKGAQDKQRRAGLREESRKEYAPGLAQDRAWWTGLRAAFESYDAAAKAFATGGPQAAANVQDPAARAYFSRKDDKLAPVVQRVLKFGQREGLLGAAQVHTIHDALVNANLGADDQRDLVHLRAGAVKKLQVGSGEREARVERRLEAARVALLDRFAADGNVSAAVARAKALRKAGVGDMYFALRSSEDKARAALVAVGVDVGKYF